MNKGTYNALAGSFVLDFGSSWQQGTTSRLQFRIPVLRVKDLLAAQKLETLGINEKRGGFVLGNSEWAPRRSD